MTFSKKGILKLFFLLIILNILLRFPLTSHEIGWDSFTIHSLANSISEFGHAKWWINPASIGGFYPYSYASSVPFMLSGLSQTTTIDMESSIWLFTTIIGILSFFTSYLMANEISNNSFFKYLVSFGYSTSQVILYFTTWTVSTRGLFISLLPLLIYLILKCKKGSLKFLTLAAVLLAFLAVTHHLVYYTIIPIIALICGLILVKIFSKLKIESGIEVIFILFLVGSAFLVPFLTGFNVKGTRYVLLEVIKTYIRYGGLFFLFSIAGFIYTIFKKEKKIGDWFLIFCLVGFMPVIYDLVYTQWVIMSILFLFGGIGIANIYYISNKNKNRNMLMFLFLIILASTIFSTFYQILPNIEEKPGIPEFWTRSTPDYVYVSSLWVKDNTQGNIMGLDVLTSIRMLSISEVPIMTGTPNDLVYGFINKSSIEVKEFPLSNILTGKDLYVLNNSVNTEWYYEQIKKEDVKGGFSRVLFNRYNLEYIVDNKLFFNRFSQSLHENKDLIYNSNYIDIYTYN